MLESDTNLVFRPDSVLIQKYSTTKFSGNSKNEVLEGIHFFKEKNDYKDFVLILSTCFYSSSTFMFLLNFCVYRTVVLFPEKISRDINWLLPNINIGKKYILLPDWFFLQVHSVNKQKRLMWRIKGVVNVLKWYQLMEFSIKFDTVSQDGPLYILRGHSFNFQKNIVFISPCRRQSKTILTIDKHGSKIARNCFLLPFVASPVTNGNRFLIYVHSYLAFHLGLL